MSDHIKHQYHKTPVLTLYALSNFTLVFLSSSFTVFILRIYYRPPLVKNHSFNHLPKVAKNILFKYLAPLVFFKINESKMIDLNENKAIKPTSETDLHEIECKQILNHLRTFNQAISGTVSSNKFIIDEKTKIFEEWKNAALILDR